MKPVWNGIICDVICDLKYPYMVLGFGENFSEIHSHMLRAEIDIEVPREYFFEVPWASEKNSAIFLNQWVQFELSPYTAVVGYANSLDCFLDHHVSCIDIPENHAVRIAYRTFGRVTGVVFPIKYPENCSKIICRNLLIESRLEFPNHCLSTGIGLKENCTELYSNLGFKLDDINLYYIRDVSNETKVHNPSFVNAIPEFVSDEILVLNQKYVGFIGVMCLVFCITIPGVFQYFGTEDKSWGSVLNQSIGTGSVLVTAILVLFQRFFGTSAISKRSIDGTFSIRSNFSAKIFAWKKVKRIKEIACDTRIPNGLISNYNNSLSRLRISNEVSPSDLWKHGYIPILDKGLVIDCLTARYLTCSFVEGKRNKLRLNRNRQWRKNKRCLKIEDSYIFE